MNERRIARLQELIKERAAEVIDHELDDPRASGMITVTKVVLDKEMMSCRIFWSVYGTDAQKRNAERLLESARGYVQREIAKVLSTRTVPRVEFRFDESIAGAIRIQEILEDIKREHPEDAAGSDPASDDSDD